VYLLPIFVETCTPPKQLTTKMGNMYTTKTINYKDGKHVHHQNNSGDFRLIHNLSYPTQYSVNDFIDPEFCTVRYSGIDDAIDMINRIGKRGKLAKTDIKSLNYAKNTASLSLPQMT
jgi:hypothetical protein